MSVSATGKARLERELHSIVEYNPLTGYMKNKLRPKQALMSNSKICCQPISRIAWFYVNGTWPTGIIEFIDGDKSNIQIKNLADVSASEKMYSYYKSKDL